jgi:hypothetical protein
MIAFSVDYHSTGFRREQYFAGQIAAAHRFALFAVVQKNKKNC